MICKFLTRVIQYFCFPEEPIKVGSSWISRKRVNLRKVGVGGMTHLINYALVVFQKDCKR